MDMKPPEIKNALFYFLLGMSLPEGVDPSFLAALPENIRQEVLREHLGMRNTPTPPSSSSSLTTPVATPVSAVTATTTATTATTSSTVTPGDPANSISRVNPEFLAALPPHIQEEVGLKSLWCRSIQNSVRSQPGR